MTYLLVGNYGVGNLGDEALREYFLLRFPQVQWRVVSAHPGREELPRLPGGVRSLLSLRWLRTLGALRKSDGMVLGGGSLFTDTESVRACFLWWVHVLSARVLRKRIILAYQGIGPFRTRMGEWFARAAVRSAHFISVRDPLSAVRVRTWRCRADVQETFDPVLSLVEEQKIDLSAQKVLVVIPRNNSDAFLREHLSRLLQSGRFEHVSILSLKPDDSAESAYCQSLRASLRTPGTIVPVRTLHDLVSSVARGSLVLTQRYHGAIVALALGLELDVIPQTEGDKLDALRALISETPAHGRRQRLRQKVEAGERALKEVL